MTEAEAKSRKRRRRHRRPARVKDLPEIFFCGDPHGSFDHINEAARLYKPAAMIILGDLQPPGPLDEVLAEALSCTDIWWIPGNHDTDSDEIYDYLWRGPLAGHNLHGRVANIAGLRIAGLGGVFRGQVWMPDGAPNYYCPATFVRRMSPGNLWRGGLPRRHRTTIFPSVYNNLLRQRADILVTHEAPGCHRKGFAALDKLGRALGVRWYFHGHQHEDRVYGQHLGMTVRGVGYRGIVNLKGEVIVPAQMDPREAAALQNAIAWANRGAPQAPEADLTSCLEAIAHAKAGPAAPKLLLPPVQLPSLPRPPQGEPHLLVRQVEATDAEHEQALGREVARQAPGGRWKPAVPGVAPVKKSRRRRPSGERSTPQGEAKSARPAGTDPRAPQVAKPTGDASARRRRPRRGRRGGRGGKSSGGAPSSEAG